MKLLADENISALTVNWLRQIGHDVLWASEHLRQTADQDLLRIANDESRVLLTEDLDFGELVYRQGLVSAGVILLRLRAPLQADRLQLLQAQWPQIEARASGHFIVVSNRKLRVRPLQG